MTEIWENLTENMFQSMTREICKVCGCKDLYVQCFYTTSFKPSLCVEGFYGDQIL